MHCILPYKSTSLQVYNSTFFNGFRWITKDPIGFAMDFSVSSMDSMDFQWISLDVNGFEWIFNGSRLRVCVHMQKIKI